MSEPIKSKPCSCVECVSYCKKRPGWFLPGEAEKVAEYLSISMAELFKKYLVVDYWVNSKDGDIDVLCPGSIEEHGCRASFGFAFGTRCIFLTDKNLCLIHPVKPFECAVSHHSSETNVHEWMSKKWKESLELIRSDAHVRQVLFADDCQGRGGQKKESEMKTRWLLRAWHDFLCWLFGHRWEEVKPENPLLEDTWRFCRRCGKAELVMRPPEHLNCKCILISPEEKT